MEITSQQHFRFGITPPDAAHVVMALLKREDVHLRTSPLLRL